MGGTKNGYCHRENEFWRAICKYDIIYCNIIYAYVIYMILLKLYNILFYEFASNWVGKPNACSYCRSSSQGTVAALLLQTSKNAVSSNISPVEKRWHPSKKAISFKVSRCVTPTQLSEDSHFKT